MPFQHRLFAVLGAALVAAACRETLTDRPAAPVAPAPAGVYALTLSSSALSIVQGSIAAVSVDVRRTNFTGSVTLEVEASRVGGTMPDGVSVGWTPKVVSGNRSVLTFTVDSSAVPGVYEFMVFGIERQGPGVPGFALITLTVLPDLSVHELQQWAATATASSQYDDVDWAAKQATGAPNVAGCRDDQHAWATVRPDTEEWLELTFLKPVHPRVIRIRESWRPGAIVKVEVKNAAGEYTTVYTSEVNIPACPNLLEIAVTGVTEMISVVRISVDQSVYRDWTEIDAVQLVGLPAAPQRSLKLP